MSAFNINENPQGMGAIPWLTTGLKILWKRMNGMGNSSQPSPLYSGSEAMDATGEMIYELPIPEGYNFVPAASVDIEDGQEDVFAVITSAGIRSGNILKLVIITIGGFPIAQGQPITISYILSKQTNP